MLCRPCPKADELESLIRGIAFLQEIYPNECYTFIPSDSGNQPRKVVIPMKQSVYPFILVNIGSGVSILRVTSENICERVGGCPMGGGTFFGPEGSGFVRINLACPRSYVEEAVKRIKANLPK